MAEFTRRGILKTGAGLAAAGALGSGGLIRPAHAQDLSYTPESGATLRVLRWAKFVQGDETQWLANTKAFSDKYGVPVRVDSEGWEDIRPKAAVAANVGSGPDIVLVWFDDAQLYPDKLLDVTELANYLGNKYGGWYEGLRQENARRQYEPGRDINREPPAPSYDAYEKERQRLQKEARP